MQQFLSNEHCCFWYQCWKSVKIWKTSKHSTMFNYLLREASQDLLSYSVYFIFNKLTKKQNSGRSKLLWGVKVHLEKFVSSRGGIPRDDWKVNGNTCRKYWSIGLLKDRRRKFLRSSFQHALRYRWRNFWKKLWREFLEEFLEKSFEECLNAFLKKSLEK